MNEKLYYSYWRLLSKSKDLTFEIIENNPDIPWVWFFISENPNITWEIIENNPDIPWNWRSLNSIYDKYSYKIKDNRLSISEIMNCFLYDDPKLGLETMVSLY